MQFSEIYHQTIANGLIFRYNISYNQKEGIARDDIV